MPVSPALDIYCNGKGSCMAVSSFHVHCKSCCAASKSHAADSERVYSFKNLSFELVHRGIKRLEQSFFCKPGCRIGRTSDSNSYRERGAGHSACIYYGLSPEFFMFPGFGRVNNPKNTL